MKYGLVIGSAKCININLTNKLLPYTTSIAINAAASIFQADYASTSEKEAYNNWQSLGNKCKNLLVHESVDKNGYICSDKIELENNNKLFYGHHNSALPAINYLLKLNCKSIIISGITFDPNWNYINLDIGKYHSENHCKQIREDLYKFSQYCKLYCINQNTFDSNYVSTINEFNLLFNIENK